MPSAPPKVAKAFVGNLVFHFSSGEHGGKSIPRWARLVTSWLIT